MKDQMLNILNEMNKKFDEYADNPNAFIEDSSNSVLCKYQQDFQSQLEPLLGIKLSTEFVFSISINVNEYDEEISKQYAKILEKTVNVVLSNHKKLPLYKNLDKHEVVMLIAKSTNLAFTL